MMPRAPAVLTARLASLDRPEDWRARDDLIFEALSDRSPSVRAVGVAWAARCLEPARLLPLVAEEADAAVRNAALAALERQGPYAVSAVKRLTADADSDQAMFACQVLGGIGGDECIELLLVALARPEINVVQAAAEALGRLRARAAVPALVGLLDREPWLQLAAADALGSIGDRGAVEPLLELVPDSFIAEAALDALRRLASPDYLPTLLPLLLDRTHAALRVPLLDAICAALPEAGPSEALRMIGRTIESDRGPDSLWRFLAERLGESESAPAAPADGALARDDRGQRRGGSPAVRAAGTLVIATEVVSLLPLVLRWAADREGMHWIRPLVDRFGVEAGGRPARLLGDPNPMVRAGCLRVFSVTGIGVAPLLKALGDTDAAVRIAATDLLGELGDAAATEPLAGRVRSGVPAEAAAAIRALARMPAPALEPVLTPWLADDAPEAAVVAALSVLAGTYVEGLEARVLELAAKSPNGLRRLALRAVANVPGSRAEVLLLRTLADRDASLQVEALDLLVGRGGNRLVTTLLALISVPDSLRYHVIRALGRLRVEKALGPLTALFPTAPLHEQLEILGALARLGGEEARAFLRGALAATQKEVRRAAAQGLADVAEPGDLELFRDLAGESDWVLRGEAARALGALKLPEAQATLLDLARDLEPAVARTARAALAGRP
jgi:HEAT repeat protein